MKLNPAEYVIKMFGGVRATGRALSREASTISKWRKPTWKQGTGGKVPRKAAEQILRYAKKNGMDIQPHDLVYGR